MAGLEETKPTALKVAYREGIEKLQAGDLYDISVELINTYQQSGNDDNMDEAIKATEFALEVIPEGHEYRPGCLSNLGVLYGYKYQRTGDLAVLDAAIKVARDAVETLPRNDQNRAACLNNLGVRLCDRYERKIAGSDLDEAIRVTQEAIALTAADDLDRCGWLSNLGMLYGNRYSRNGHVSDLDEAIRATQEAIDKTPKDDPDRLKTLSNFGVHLNNRYAIIGAMADLDESIRVAQEVIEATPKDHVSRASRLNNLATDLRERFQKKTNISDIEKAIKFQQEAVRITPKDHINRAGYLNNLGILFGAIGIYEAADEVTQMAVDTTPEGHPSQGAFLNSLSALYVAKYMRTESRSDLDEAIRLARAAVDAIPEDHPNLTMYSYSLGQRLGDRYHSQAGRVADLNEAIRVLRNALCQPASDLYLRLAAGKLTIEYCAAISDWSQGFELSEIAIPLIQKLSGRSLRNSDKQDRLSQMVGLASIGAAMALHAGKEPLVALQFLEQGRGVLAASLEEVRTDVLDLQDKHPYLAEQFNLLRDEIDTDVTSDASLVDESGNSLWRVQANRRYEAGNRFDALITEIRKQPGFEDFLNAPSGVEIQDVAKYGPIIVINISDYRCDAIIVEHHQIQSLVLPGLTREELAQKAQGSNLGDPEVLEWLWDTIAHPVLRTLGFNGAPSGHTWPRVWWIPTGPLSKFALHAAGYHSRRSNEAVIDRVMSSYSPSVRAIVHSHRRIHPTPITLPPAQALLVGIEHTPGQYRLPFATHEVQILYSILESASFQVIEPKRRKKQDIIALLPKCKIFHFAGHGHTNSEDASRSHLLLEGGTIDSLTVATLLELNLRKHSPFLAYLSACGTGRVKNDKFVDENLHLIASFQLAGYRHVIGTLWEVKDELCVDMARLTYGGMRNGGMTDVSVCQGLHNATRELRDRALEVEERKATAPSGERHSRRVSHGTNRDDRLPRDVVLCDDEEKQVLHWVPYLHFGV